MAKPLKRPRNTRIPVQRTTGVTPSLVDRKRMVSEAAYYIAERRGFRPGNELHDWLQAERQVDAQLSQY